jgi:hypothetical protein
MRGRTGHQEGAGEARRWAHQGGDPVHDHLEFKLMYMMHTKLDLGVLHMHEKRTR